MKPQFEAGREAVGKGGLVKDRQVHWRVMQELISEGMKSRLYLSDFCVSPIEGGDGNREYLALFRKDSPCVCDEHRLKAVIFTINEEDSMTVTLLYSPFEKGNKEAADGRQPNCFLRPALRFSVSRGCWICLF